MEWVTQRGRAAYERGRRQGVPAQWALAWARQVMEAEQHEDWPSVTGDYSFTLDFSAGVGINVVVQAEPDQEYEHETEFPECRDHAHFGLVGTIGDQVFDSVWGFCDPIDYGPGERDYELVTAYEVALETLASYRDELARENERVLAVI